MKESEPGSPIEYIDRASIGNLVSENSFHHIGNPVSSNPPTISTGPILSPVGLSSTLPESTGACGEHLCG